MRGLSCPWCGRPVVLRKDGTLPSHKSNEWTLTGRSRLHCRGEGQDPDSLSEPMRAVLRKEWRADDGSRLVSG